MLAMSIALWLLVATMMVVRVPQRGLPGHRGSRRHREAIAVALGAALVVLNATVLYLAFADGSADTRDLDRLARVVVPSLRRHERLARRLAAQTQELGARAAARRLTED
jgi:hypothetical protein